MVARVVNTWQHVFELRKEGYLRNLKSISLSEQIIHCINNDQKIGCSGFKLRLFLRKLRQVLRTIQVQLTLRPGNPLNPVCVAANEVPGAAVA